MDKVISILKEAGFVEDGKTNNGRDRFSYDRFHVSVGKFTTSFWTDGVDGLTKFESADLDGIKDYATALGSV